MSLPPPEQKRRFVEHMFDDIAPRYELLNQLMTFGRDRAWRGEAVASLRIETGTQVVDLGCGTGDLATVASAAGAKVVGVDISTAMLTRARRRLPRGGFARADAQWLPLRDACCDAVVTGFALRNFISIPAVLAECARVLRPGGRLAILEVDVPESALARAGFDLYFNRIVPALGGLVSRGYAYRYLSQSLAYLPPARDFEGLVAAAGFGSFDKRRLTAGAAQLVTAIRE